MAEAEVEDERRRGALKIMIASDIHLGYNEKDPERGNDSFNTFEEVLQLAVATEVDLILLGGDLFHDNNPSTHALNRCLKLLRIYCMGDKPIEIEFMSNQAINFTHSLTQTVNYEDPNINISIPVFSIHGNHDDPSGFGNLSSLDLLSTSGLVNYFGSWTDVNQIQIEPILMQKNETKLAIYGLSYIHDNRLFRLFDDGKVSIKVPPEPETWFNIFVVHQNRANRGIKNFLPEEALPSWADLIIWGHEHDCRIDPERNMKKNFFVIQPGSTVATSLAHGESIEKHCAVLYLDKGDFNLEKIPLKTVRPFVFSTCRIVDVIDEQYLAEGAVEKKVKSYVKSRIAEMLDEAHDKITGHDMQPSLPLIRLRVEVSEACQMFHPVQFGQEYMGVVANPLDMIMFKKQFQKVKSEAEGVDKNLMDDAYDTKQSGHGSNKVEDVVKKYFEEARGKHKLKVISVDGFQEMTRLMLKAEGKDDDKRREIIKFYMDECTKDLETAMATAEDIPDKMETFRSKENETFQNLLKFLDAKTSKVPMDVDDDGSGSTAGTKASKTSTRGGRGRGRGRGNTSTVSTTRAAPTAKKAPLDFQPKPSTSRAPPKRATSNKITTYLLSSDSD